MTLSELCKEVLELDAKATPGPWRIDDVINFFQGRVSLEDCQLFSRYRTACVKLALAAQRMEEALKQCDGPLDQCFDYAGGPTEAGQALADVQKIVEGK